MPSVRERYRSLFETINDALVIFDAETQRFVEVNEAACRLYGYSREEFLQLLRSDISADKEGSEETIRQTSTGELERIPIHQHRRKDGHVFPVEISASSMRTDGRTLLCGVIRDVTERVRVDKALRDREALFRTLFRDAPIGMVVTDGQGRLQRVNRALERMLQYGGGELTGRHWSELTHPADLEEDRRQLEEVRRGRRANVGMRKRYLRRDGETLWAWSTASALHDGQGGFSSYLIMIVDIQQRLAAENALRESERKLAEQNLLLERKNAALHELLGEVERERERLQARIQANAETLLLPLVEEIKQRMPDEKRPFVDLLDANLRQLTATFGNSMREARHKLTPREIQVADMVRQGLPTKEVARLLGVSARTVEVHRGNIRHKLGIAGKGINLVTYLSSL